MASVEPLLAKDICIGCGACAQACSADCLSVDFDDSLGIRRCRTNLNPCSNCGLCLKVCPFAQTTLSNAIASDSTLFLSHSRDPELRRSSASGGSVTQLLLSLMRNGQIDGAMVVGAGDSPLSHQYLLATTQEEALSSRGSVYAPVSTENIYKILQSLPDSFRVAFVGLPCVVGALRRLTGASSKRFHPIALYIGLFCGRSPSAFATSYFLSRLGVHPSEVQHINYRDEGWPGDVTVYFNDGRTIKTPYRSAGAMGTVLSSNLFLPKPCYFCNDPFSRHADISVGDAWLERLKNDKNGYSLLLTHTPEGEKSLSEAADDLVLAPLPKSELAAAHGRLVKSKGAGYHHRIWLYRRFHHSLRKIMQPNQRSLSLVTLLREGVFMPFYLTIHRLRLARLHQHVPFVALRILKLLARVWR